MLKFESLVANLKSGTINRRNFMEGAAYLGVSTTVATAAMTSVANAAPKKGGNLIIAMAHGSTSDSVDPTTYENGWSNMIAHSFEGYLTEIGADGNLAANLAESWESTKDAKTWRFNLRKGAEFHNGKSVEAEDVVASFAIHRGEDSKSGAKSILESVVTMKADGKNAVVFELESGNADFPFIMSDYHLVIRPSKGGKVTIDQVSAVGSGPYKLARFDPGVTAVLERSGNHWKHDDQCWFDSSEVLSITDPNARQNAIATGTVHVMDRPDLKTAHLLARRPGIEVEQATGYQHYTFPMRMDTAPFDNPDVRLALKYGLDRDVLLKTVLKGFGQVGNDHPISPANRYFHKDLPQRSYDIDKAKFHTNKSGLGTINVDLSAADAAYPGAVDAAVIYQEQAAKAGIKINVVREPNDGYWSNVWNKKPFCACYWGGRPTEDWMFSTAYQGGGAWNDTVQNFPKFDELLLNARAELDDSKRRVMYHDMQEIVHNDGGVIVPYYSAHVWAKIDKVGHAEQIAANWTMDGSRTVERWWFNS